MLASTDQQLCVCLLTSLETPLVCSWSCCAERRYIHHKKGTETGQTKIKWLKCCWQFLPKCVSLRTCLPSQWRNSTVWLPSPTRLKPGQQTRWLAAMCHHWAALSHLLHIISRSDMISCIQNKLYVPELINHCLLTNRRPSVSPFPRNSARVQSSSLAPWRPASLLCSTEVHPSPQTHCSLQSLRS